MREWPVVFAKLARPKGDRVLDPFNRMTALIAGILLVTKHRQTLFETQLKPIAAGNAVAGPIVEVFMGDDGFDAFEIRIRAGFR